VDDVWLETPNESPQAEHGHRIRKRRLVMLTPHPREARKCSHLPNPVHANPPIILDCPQVVLPNGRDDDFMSALVELAREQSALDLRTADIGRVVICREQDAHYRLRGAAGKCWLGISDL
jgi:hypothetical protein